MTVKAREVLAPAIARRITGSARGNVVTLTWDEPRNRSGRGVYGGRLNSANTLIMAAAKQIAGLNPTIEAGKSGRLVAIPPTTPFRSVEAAWLYLHDREADLLSRSMARGYLVWLARNGHPDPTKETT
jgi:hypothetical protein